MSFEKGEFVFTCVSLKNGGKKAYPEATHELQVFPVRDGTNPEASYYMLKGDPEFTVQFHGIPDSAASALPHVMVRACIKGSLPPRRSKMREWQTVLHALFIRYGVHSSVFM